MNNNNDLTERKALEMLWPFIAEEKCQYVTPSYAKAIFNAAKVLGKKCTLESRNNGIAFVVELED